MLQEVERAQIVINQNKEKVSQGKMRQKYHFMAETGWINDPNGLIYFKGKYHFFYQYNPYQSFWENMHWGHAVSDDLIHWEYLPVALAPSEPYEDHLKGGCFSGSAIEFDGKLYLIYTAATNHGNGFVQTQCVAYSEDGIHFEKYEKNPVLTAPEGISPDSFRDPKVWKHEDSYYMVCGASKNQKGQALLYRSEDLIHWTFINVLAESRGEWGTMWECPDFFRIGNRYVLTFSPIGAGERTCVYLTGSFDYDTGRFDYDVSGEIDWGFDYYAPQSFQAPDGRRIMVAWANEWEWMPFFKDWGPTYREDWCGFFNFPREVNMTKSGRLSFVPIRELKKYRKKALGIFVGAFVLSGVLMGVGFHWTHGVAMYENVILNYGVQGDTAYLTLQGKPGYELNFSGATDQNKSSLKVMYARNIWGHDENVVRLEGESNRSGEPPQWILEFKDRIVVIENGELVDEKIK